MDPTNNKELINEKQVGETVTKEEEENYGKEYEFEEEFEDEDYYYEDYEERLSSGTNSFNSSGQTKMQTLSAKYEKYMNLDKKEYSHEVGNKLREQEKKQEQSRFRIKDKSARATTELVIDDRTRMILFKFFNAGVIQEMNGCISTGKEANVYYAVSKEGKEYGVKIYKTSILVFKDRDRYVTGEFRWRSGYAKHNPRKMVRMWAEKELRNLSRLQKAGVLCPQPLLVKQHVLIMEFIGANSVAAPRLKDATFSDKRAEKLYFECVAAVRIIYHKAKLVHADLSEFNIL